MKKEILVAVDDSAFSKQAVKYAMSMPGVVKDLSFTLFHIQPTISHYIIEEAERDPVAKAKLNKVFRQNTEKARAVLADFKQQMVDGGIDEDRIKSLTRLKASGVAKDILDQALISQPDAIVVGRSGRSKAREMIMGSVTCELLEHAEVIPVWVVDNEVSSENIMLAVDGSESSLRAVDHVSFMLKDNTDVTITLLHVKPRFGDFVSIDFDTKENEVGDLLIEGDQRRIKNFYAHALKKFSQAGIREDQLKIIDAACTAHVGKTIINEVNKGKCGTIVIGRSGINKSFFFGSVSRYVLEKATNCAIWLVP